jgi:selenocysteine lyase/cysteine desulfurase
VTTDWARIRDEFPALTNWTFLNTATFGQMPRRAVEAVERHYRHRDALACRDFLDWFGDADRLRQSIGQLTGTSASDVAFTPSAAHGLSLLMGQMAWERGDRVVTLENEFPNQIYYPALMGAEGVEFVEARWDEFYDAINSRTRLVAISMLSYVNGFRPPLGEISKFLRERGVLLYVDGTQGLGALRLDLAATPIDILSVHAYKWMLAPTGAGFMCVRPEVRRWLKPNVVGWRSHEDWRNVDNLHHGAPRFATTGEQYEGCMLAFSLLYPLAESVGMMLELGPDQIERRVMQLAGEMRRALRDLGAEMQDGPLFDSPILSARFPGHDASALAKALAARNVLVSARHGGLRVSTHFYNSQNDLDRLAEELKPLLRAA